MGVPPGDEGGRPTEAGGFDSVGGDGLRGGVMVGTRPRHPALFIVKQKLPGVLFRFARCLPELKQDGMYSDIKTDLAAENHVPQSSD